MDSYYPSSADRALGTLLGLAAGDQNGGPIRMALRLAESLVERRGFDPDDVMRRYMEWYREGAFDTGPVALSVFARIADGQPRAVAVRAAHEASGGLTAGCGPAHRSAPLAMAVFISDDDLARAAREEAALTHFDGLAGDVAAAVVVLCRSLIAGLAWPDALVRAAAGRTEATRKALCCSGGDTGAIGRGGFAPEALAAAIRFLSQHDRLVSALEAAHAFSGPQNYCPVLVGSIGGARWGVGQVPVELIRHVELLPRLWQVGRRLASGWGSGSEVAVLRGSASEQAQEK